MKEPIKVLLIPSSDYLGHPFPQRHNHLFERLHDGRQFEVHVVRFNIFGKPSLETNCIIHEIPFEFKTSKTPLYYLANATSYTNEILRIVKQESIDVVVAGNLLPPLLYSFAVKLVERRIPFVFDLQDYYPTSAAGYITDTDSLAGMLVRGIFEAMTRYLIRIANCVTVPGIALAMYAKSVGAKDVHIIPNGVSEHFLKLHDGGKIRRELGFEENDLVVGYIGSIEFWLDMEPLIKAISLLHKQGAQIKLMLIGKHLQTGYPQKVEYWIKKYGIEKITTWLDFVPHQKVPEYIAAINIGTIPFNVKNPTAYYAAPNKLWEYLSQKRFVISTPIPEAIINRDHISIARDEQDYVYLFKEYLSEKRERLDKVVEKGYNKARQRTWQRSVQKLVNLLIASVRK